MTMIQYDPKILQEIVKKGFESWQTIENENLKLCDELHKQILTFLSENERNTSWPWSKKRYSRTECETLIGKYPRLSLYRDDLLYQIISSWKDSKDILYRIHRFSEKIRRENVHFSKCASLMRISQHSFENSISIIVEKSEIDSLFWIINNHFHGLLAQ